jgi:hypothetical protein
MPQPLDLQNLHSEMLPATIAGTGTCCLAIQLFTCPVTKAVDQLQLIGIYRIKTILSIMSKYFVQPACV